MLNVLSPRGYTYDVPSPPFNPYTTEGCYSTTLMTTPSSTAHLWSKDIVRADAVSIRWTSGDFSTAPADSCGGRSALSVTAKAGIGVGVTFGAFILITIGVVILLSRTRRKSKQVQNYTSIQSSNDEREKAEKESYLRNDSSSWSTWNALVLDTWSFEAIAIYFSVACFVAILCVLQVNILGHRKSSLLNH